MTRRRTERLIVTKVTADGARRSPDQLIVEEPMTVQLDGVTVSTTMRTPGHDFELAAGFCHTEGLLDGAPVEAIKYCGTGSAMLTEFNIVTVDTLGKAPTPSPRLGPTSSSCGWCGNDQIDELTERLAPLEVTEPFDLDVLAAVPDAVRAEQELFADTGAVHAAAVFDRSGAVRLVREDVGRHNAVDKVVGAMLLAGELPATDLGLFVSGRASVEMVQKAWAAGFAAVVAVSAPTSLAVTAARRANLVLAGFVTGATFNVYSPERL
ncbi:MAG: formate dehydrogenase family accessory protein FdhD [Acidimicrobiaceae bacterium]|nr:formate dehydrogenase family accessory protein FdhD [Acidimicrobiaceae bacterium]